MKIKIEDKKIYKVTGIDFESREFTIKKSERLYALVHCSTCEIDNYKPHLI